MQDETDAGAGAATFDLGHEAQADRAELGELRLRQAFLFAASTQDGTQLGCVLTCISAPFFPSGKTWSEDSALSRTG